jgi:Terminase large subunit, T4likevirus-type, N-terminal/Terminase RNaseH-like domain
MNYLAMALDPAQILTARGLPADPWQRDVLLSSDRQILLNCCRQAGKSTITSALALHTALFTPNQLVLLLSPGQRQSGEIFRKMLDFYNAIERPVKATYETQLKIELANGSRILCLPGKEQTIRGYSPNLLVIDEASRVPDDLYRSVRPMLAVSKGRLIALSTPFGQRGWFYDEWNSVGPWKKVKVPWQECPRITSDFIEEERRAMGNAWVQQEYECLFTALEGLVYPDFETAHCINWVPPELGTPVGGIDWGWRNPFAAVWGVIDRDDVLWIQEERYLRETSLHEHCKALPKDMMWYADPAGRTEIEEFRAAGHKIKKGYNDIRLGIAAVTARIRTGRLKINKLRCPNLIGEAKLYRYPSQAERAIIGENPVDEHNHALGALRYLISRLDSRFIAKLRKTLPHKDEIPEEQPDHTETQESFKIRRRLDINDPNLWTSIN